MSRIAKQEICIPLGVKVKYYKNFLVISNKDRKNIYKLNKSIILQIYNNKIRVCFDKLKKYLWPLAGVTRTIIYNMIVGVTIGFVKILSLVGVGYKAEYIDHVLKLSIGYSHKVHYSVPKDIKLQYNESENQIIITGFNKQLVGDVAAQIRNLRPPIPYKKGKGIRYLSEVVRIKEHKKKLK